MSDLHIDDFCKDVARILNTLYGRFPRKTTVYVEDIAGADEPDEFGLHSDRHLACLGALIWLGEERWIRHEGTVRQQAVDQAVLTGESFALLTAVAGRLTRGEREDLGTGLPASLRAQAREGFGDAVPETVVERQHTNINRLRLALRSRASERVRAVVLDLMARR